MTGHENVPYGRFAQLLGKYNLSYYKTITSKGDRVLIIIIILIILILILILTVIILIILRFASYCEYRVSSNSSNN